VSGGKKFIKTDIDEIAEDQDEELYEEGKDDD